jgi:hypothetical protein
MQSHIAAAHIDERDRDARRRIARIEPVEVIAPE